MPETVAILILYARFFMSISPDQLGEIFRSLHQTFNDHPLISIRPLKGDPPEQYEIVYSISGYCKTGKNDVKLAEEHHVELTIPFGFPHFPPSCKPKTEIFHPDFDPAAVCLGDFWQPGRSVPDLVIHIGRLINGETYSTDNAFNEEAARWYFEHRELFPLAKQNWTTGTDAHDFSADATPPQIDTIEDYDLTSEFEFLSIESSNEDRSTPSEKNDQSQKQSQQEDLNYLHSLQNRKKFFTLSQFFETSPPVSEEAKELDDFCCEQIAKSEALFRSAKEMEESSNLLTDPKLAPSYRESQRPEAINFLKKAKKLLLEIGSIVSDYPHLETEIRGVERSLTALREIDTPSATDLSTFDSQSSTANKAASESPQGKRIGGAKKIAVNIPRLTFKTIAVLTVAVTALLLCALSGAWFFSSQQLQQATTELAACSVAFENNAFEEAKSTCELSLKKASPLFGLHKAESEMLTKKLNEILSSEKLRQGLAGNLLVNGKYLPKKEAMALENFQRLQKEAEALFTQQQWTEAEDRYGKLLALAEKGTASDGNTIKEIKNRLGYLRFVKAFGAANALIAAGKWQEATTALQKAKGLLESLPEEERRRHEMELNAALAKCNFEEFRQLGDDFFSKSDWGKAIATYKAALPTAENNKLASQETLNELRQNIARAELYAAIDAGNKAFAEANWEAAILEYNKAGNLLNSQMESIKTADAQFTRKKIDRIILQTMVIRDRQAAQTAEIDKQDPVTARNIYKQLVATLNNSGLVNEDEFAEIKKTSLVAIDGLEKKIYLADKEKYLKDNFRRLFQLNYPAAVAENLTSPQITFIKEVDGKLIFKMQCQETGQGRPLALVMFYAYDKTGNRWDFHSEQQ